MSRSLVVLVALSFACNGDDPDTDTDTDPVVTDCDVDGDGVEGEQCGGPDCDDGEEAVRPGAPETLSDGVDQDCDGFDGFGITHSIEFDGEVVGSWSWRPDLLALGGGVVKGGGVVGGSTIVLNGAEAGATWERVDRTTAELGSLIAPPVRLWGAVGAVDVLLVEGEGASELVTWSDVGRRSLGSFGGEPPSWLGAAVYAGRVHVVRCGAGSLTWATASLASGIIDNEATVEHTGDRCVVLAANGTPQILGGSASPGPVVRWRVGEGVLKDRVELFDGKSVDPLVARTQGGAALFAFADGERIYVFGASGDGSIVDAGGDVVRLAIDSDGADGFAVGWTTVDGNLHVGVGVLSQDPEIVSRPVADPESPVAVGISTDALTVAWVAEGRWTISRAWR